jgi:hypothetical protein
MGEKKIEGRLRYNPQNERYGVLVSSAWKNEGLHCGEVLEVLIDEEWVIDRIEMLDVWYLVYSKLKGNELENLQVRY